MIYTRQALIESYLDVERYKSAVEVLVQDSQTFTVALQKAFGIPLHNFLRESFFSPLGPLALLFKRGVVAVLAQDSGILEEGLLYNKLEERGEMGRKLLQQYTSVGQARYEVTQRAMKLLLDVMEATWPNAPQTVTSEDLLRLGFDDSQRPDPMDYW